MTVNFGDVNRPWGPDGDPWGLNASPTSRNRPWVRTTLAPRGGTHGRPSPDKEFGTNIDPSFPLGNHSGSALRPTNTVAPRGVLHFPELLFNSVVLRRNVARKFLSHPPAPIYLGQRNFSDPTCYSRVLHQTAVPKKGKLNPLIVYPGRTRPHFPSAAPLLSMSEV